jgi:adenine deaminase
MGDGLSVMTGGKGFGVSCRIPESEGRHHATNSCRIEGFGLQRGVIACATSCETQKLSVIETSDQEIVSAVKAIERLGGGFVAVLDYYTIEAVKLDAAACMSSKSWEKVRDISLECNDAVHNILGSKMEAPFMIASFVELVAVPDLGLTELGLIDSKTQGPINVVLSNEDREFQPVSSISSSKSIKVCCRCPSHAHDIHRLMDSSSLELLEYMSVIHIYY